MKKIICLFLILISFGCSRSNRIISEIENSCGLYDTPFINGYGEKVYVFSVRDKDVFVKELKVKGIIDKQLRILPSIQEMNKIFHMENTLYNWYVWETPNIRVKMECSFPTNSKIKLWIYDK
jgi:hypothetical protein